jgi:Tfp pilus assembly protein PilX
MQVKVVCSLSPGRGQQGAVLVAGLMLMLVLTVLGISSMNMVTMEITMAGSAQAQQDAFQLAESAIDIALATENYTTAEPRTIALLGVADFDRQAVTAYTDVNTPIPGEANSHGVAGAMEAWHFEVVAQSQGPRNAAASHTQGFYVRGRSE